LESCALHGPIAIIAIAYSDFADGGVAQALGVSRLCTELNSERYNGEVTEVEVTTALDDDKKGLWTMKRKGSPQQL